MPWLKGWRLLPASFPHDNQSVDLVVVIVIVIIIIIIIIIVAVQAATGGCIIRHRALK